MVLKMESSAEQKQRREIRVGFAWQTLTSENLGVAALAQSQLAIATEAAASVGLALRAIEFCPTGPGLALASSLKCEIGDPLSIKGMISGKSKYARQIRECDLILDIGAGDSFSDIYGSKHFFFLCLSKAIALALGKPLVLSPQTIGPYKNRLNAKIASFLIRRARKVFARDGMSVTELHALDLAENAVGSIDVAFSLPYTQRDSARDTKVRVGVNVSGLLMNGGYTGKNQFSLASNYCELVRDVIGHFCSLPSTEVHLVGHVNSESLPVEDDYAANVELRKDFPSVVVAPRFGSPSEAKSYIHKLDFFTGGRMHACIAAYSSGVPTVPMAYSRKFNGLFDDLGYPHYADLRTESRPEVTRKIFRGFEDREELARLVEKGNALATEKLKVYRNYLVELFSEIK